MRFQPAHPERCGDCGALLVSAHRTPPPGYRQHGGRGLCGRCYGRLIRTPERRAVDNARRRAVYNARRRRERPPQPVDEVAVYRACHGDRVHLTVTERKLAVSWLTGHGYTAQQAADRLHTTRRTVERIRAKLAADRTAQHRHAA
jgi:DNA-binding CsgD family transcriptional regulator